jgi:hypothetical protein
MTYHVVTDHANSPHVYHTDDQQKAEEFATAERRNVGHKVRVLTDEEWDALPNRRHYWTAIHTP